eukprot:scaffold219417_cov41-Prasinocladus_malaysianus.AAC.1
MPVLRGEGPDRGHDRCVLEGLDIVGLEQDGLVVVTADPKPLPVLLEIHALVLVSQYWHACRVSCAFEMLERNSLGILVLDGAKRYAEACQAGEQRAPNAGRHQDTAGGDSTLACDHGSHFSFHNLDVKDGTVS